MPTDAELLIRYATGDDEDAFRLLVHGHAPWIRASCQRILGDAGLADDATQAVFILLAREAGRIRDPSRLCAWLKVTACRVALNVQRSERSRKAREWTVGREHTDRIHRYEFDAAIGEVDQELDQARNHLDDCLDRLSVRQRDAVVRYYLRGQSAADIAVELGCTADAVRKRVAKGLTALRRLLARRGVAVTPAVLLAVAAPGQAPASSGLLAACAAAGTGGGETSVPASLIAKGVIKTMFIKKLALAASLAVTLLIGGGALALIGAQERSTVIWGQDYGSSAADVGQEVVVDGAGNLYMAVTAGGDLAQTTTVEAAGRVIIKLAPNGTRTWVRHYGTGTIHGMDVAADGDLYVIGTGGLQRLSPAGDVRWTRMPSNISGLYGVAVADGGIYVAGIEGGTSTGNAVLLRYESDGDLDWRREFGTKVSSLFSRRVRVACDAAGNAAVVANVYDISSHSSKALVALYDEQGNRSWLKNQVAGVSRLYDVAFDSSGNILAAGGGRILSWAPDGADRWTFQPSFFGMYDRVDLSVGHGAIYVSTSRNPQNPGEGYRSVLIKLRESDGAAAWLAEPPFGTLDRVSSQAFAGDLVVTGTDEVVMVDSVATAGNQADVKLLKLAVETFGDRRVTLRLVPEPAGGAEVYCIETMVVQPYVSGAGVIYDLLQQDQDHTFELTELPVAVAN